MALDHIIGNEVGKRGQNGDQIPSHLYQTITFPSYQSNSVNIGN